MLRIFMRTILAVAIYAQPAFAEPSLPIGMTDLEVVVDEIPNSNGNVRLAVYSEADAALFPDQIPPLKQTAVAAGRAIAFHFSGLAAGRYAVLAFHDENSNEVLDRNFLGIPKERWAVSGKRPFGRNPRFAESSFVLDVQHRKINLHLE